MLNVAAPIGRCVLSTDFEASPGLQGLLKNWVLIHSLVCTNGKKLAEIMDAAFRIRSGEVYNLA